MFNPAPTKVFGGRRRGRPRKELSRPDKPLSEYTREDVWHEGERIAANHLTSIGLDVIERNWRCPFGEADIVAIEEETVVLVEVKCRIGSPEQGIHPEDSVDDEKCERYRNIARYFVGMHPDVRSVRFDVIAVNLLNEDQASLRRYVSAASWDD